MAAEQTATQTDGTTSKFGGVIPAVPTDQQILQDLGYNPGKQGEQLQSALTTFAKDHGGDSSETKLQAVYAQAQADQKAFAAFAPNITLAQTHAIDVASESTHVPAETIAKLAAGQRAFDPSFKRQDGRQPGLVQMNDTSWLTTVQQVGANFPRTKELAAEMNQVDDRGRPLPVTSLSQGLQNEVFALRNDPVVAAQIGSEYAKNNPVQLDTINTYVGQTPSVTAQAKQLESSFASLADIKNYNPSQHPEWSAPIVNTALAASGLPESNGGRPTTAADFKDYGTPVNPQKGGQVKPGDVAVFMDQDNNVNHVAIVSAVNGNGTFNWIGGDQPGARLGQVNEDGGASLNSSKILFREPPPNAFMLAEKTYQAQLSAGADSPAAAAPPAAGSGTATAPAPAKPGPKPPGGAP